MKSRFREAETDCLLVGFNDQDFADYVDMARAMGTDSGAYRDLDLAFIEYNGKPMRSIDLLNHFYFEEKEKPAGRFHNADFLWPVITVLGSYLAQRGLTFDYVNLFHLEKERLREKLSKNDTLTVAITTTLYVSPYPILEIVSFIRQYNDTAKIILGGPYISNQVKMADPTTLQNMFKYLGADVYVNSSEGEFALACVIQALKGGVSLDRVDNIAYKDGEEYIITQTATESNSLEENPVSYSLFPSQDFGEFVTLRTAKSCPFSCSFCGFPQRAGKYTYLSVELVEQELNRVAEIGSVSTLTFIDDTFNVPKGRFKEILRMMIRNKYGFKWNSYLRSDHTDDETLSLMAESGCEGVFLGVESGSDQMLQRMNKTSRRKDYLRVIPQLKALGISTHASLIVGFPGETFETNQETIDFIEEAQPDFFRTQLWYCDPTTPIWHEREKYGVKGSAFNWSHDSMDVKTACDLIDRAFLCVNNSIWLPQNGFDQWSTFYLQRKGMTLEQIKTFIKCFNAIVKEKLIHGGRKEADPALLDRLKKSAQFDKAAECDLGPIELLSGGRYTAAENFWAEQFGAGIPASNIDAVKSDGGGTPERFVAWRSEIDDGLLETASRATGASRQEIVLAAFSFLLSRLNGKQDALVIVADTTGPEARPVPLRLHPLWELSFNEYVKQVRQQIREIVRARPLQPPHPENPLRMARKGCGVPEFSVGYTYCETGDRESGVSLENLMEYCPAALREMGFYINVKKTPSLTEVEFNYASNWFRQETVEKLSSYLAAVLRRRPRARTSFWKNSNSTREPAPIAPSARIAKRCSSSNQADRITPACLTSRRR